MQQNGPYQIYFIKYYITGLPLLMLYLVEVEQI